MSFFSSLWNLIEFIKPKKGDFYYLALLKNKQVPSGWQIHGLWSDYGNGKYPSYCEKVHFDMSKLKSIEDELNKYWPSNDHNNEKFYRHEYEKHGSCLYSKMTELEYFQKTIELYHYVINNNLYESYEKDGKCMIPFDLNFKTIFKK